MILQRKRKLTNKQQNARADKLHELVRAEILARGGFDRSRHGDTQYLLNTDLGELSISFHLSCDWNPRGSFAIFARFDDVDRAKRMLGGSYTDRLNPYSGKWNHHYHDAWTAEEAAADWIRQISRFTEITASPAVP